MKRIDINKRYSFEYYDDLIVYMIENGYMLETGEIYHISFELAKGDEELMRAVVDLLENFSGEDYDKHVALLKLINKEFRFFTVEVGNLWGYGFECENKEVAKYLIKLSKTIKHNKKMKNLNEFKEQLEAN